MKINNLNIFFYFILSISLFFDLFFNIDSAGSGGFIADYNSTWPLVENPLSYRANLDFKFPLHYYIASFIYKIVNDKEIVRFVYCLLAIPIPYLFFLCLKVKFKKINLNNLFLFSLVIFLLPSFRSAAVWPNTHITGIFFFLVALFYFLKWETKNEFKKFNIELILTIFFMSLTVYSRQIYAMIFFYFMIIFFKKLSFTLFLKTSFIVSLFALPGIIFVMFLPRILQVTFEFKLYNSLLVNSSIISFYLIPFFTIIYFFENKLNLFKGKILALLTIITFVLICTSFFDYNYLMGGGYFIKLSKIFFNNFYIFYLTSIIGFFLIYVLSKESVENLTLNLIILLSISAFIIFVKYFEPMYIVLLFLLFKTKLTNLFLKNNKYIYIYHLYFLIYLVSAIVNNYYLFSKNI
jgi:hypothetical protein